MTSTVRTTLVAVAALALGPREAMADDHRLIKLTSVCTAVNNFVDLPPLGPSTGDIYVLVDDLLAADGTTKVGDASGRCNLIDATVGSFGCTTVSRFRNGTITTEGLLFNVPGIVSVGAVTGGTGAFRGVEGEATVDIGSPCGPHNVTFKLRK